MKKLLPIILVFTLLCACAAPAAENTPTPPPVETAAPAPTATGEPTPATTAEPTPTATEAIEPIDWVAYEQYKEAVDAVYDGRLIWFQEPWPQIAGWELARFELAWEREDLGIAAYRMDAVLYADPPEAIQGTEAGGAYVDKNLRLHGIDWKFPFLAVVDGEPAGAFYLYDTEPYFMDYTLDLSVFQTQQEFIDMIESHRVAGG